jgi:peptidoglycan-associated lipoprotein
MQKKYLSKLYGFLFLTVLLGLNACSSGVKLDDVEAEKAGGSSSSASSDSKFANEPWNDPASPIFKKSFYFDFDSYTVKSSDQGLLDWFARANF